MVKGMNVLVVGLGKTGLAAAGRLSRLGSRVTVTDTRSEESLHEELSELDKKVAVSVGGHDGVTNKKFDMVVTSPGVSCDSPLLQSFRKAGVEVISEIELAYRLSSGRWIAVTGTNGKTTTTTMVGAMLRQAGIPSVVCGNIGNPAIGEDAIFDAKTAIVAEISSFQLELVLNFAPAVAAILNITPDHLDRHRSLENYASIKSMIFVRQKPADVCVLNMDDPLTAGMSPAVPSSVYGFSATKKGIGDGAFLDGGSIYISKKGGRSLIGDAKNLKVAGLANLENALAASAVAMAAGADAAAIGRALFDFEGIPHRMEQVAVIYGVRYINDSKGTNVSATVKALYGLDAGATLILGGRDKGSDFLPLAEVIREKGVRVILIGEAADKIARSLGDYPDVERAATLEEAVRMAASFSETGEVVLLSPACASFDMFKNYEERGEKFRQAVLGLEQGMGAVNG
jgi:UDP-N-acetylmuramoylalanine--D-glutamate ligase